MVPRLTATAPAWRDRAALAASYENLFRGVFHGPEEGSAVLTRAGRGGGAARLHPAVPEAWGAERLRQEPCRGRGAEGRGVGRFLMDAAKVKSKTSRNNTRARAFSERAGFREDHVALVRRLE
ncbi:N-acetyltransferase [Deinococcus aetherius]|uniref:hypothetical protein n=1 Tax=Deinococcus aetherius TaxID=200252 RepID=UPI0022319CCD|nr:hypothetical protein [Deinococcus aetherius]